MNIIYNGSITRDGTIYDYSAVWTRRSGGIAWKAIVRNSDVVCRPSGVLEDVLTDGQVRQVITQLVDDSIASLQAHARTAARAVNDAASPSPPLSATALLRSP